MEEKTFAHWQDVNRDDPGRHRRLALLHLRPRRGRPRGPPRQGARAVRRLRPRPRRHAAGLPHRVLPRAGRRPRRRSDNQSRRTRRHRRVRSSRTAPTPTCCSSTSGRRHHLRGLPCVVRRPSPQLAGRPARRGPPRRPDRRRRRGDLPRRGGHDRRHPDLRAPTAATSSSPAPAPDVLAGAGDDLVCVTPGARATRRRRRRSRRRRGGQHRDDQALLPHRDPRGRLGQLRGRPGPTAWWPVPRRRPTPPRRPRPSATSSTPAAAETTSSPADRSPTTTGHRRRRRPQVGNGCRDRRGARSTVTSGPEDVFVIARRASPDGRAPRQQPVGHRLPGRSTTGRPGARSAHQLRRRHRGGLRLRLPGTTPRCTAARARTRLRGSVSGADDRSTATGAATRSRRRGGDDRIRGGDGNDRLLGGGGRDDLRGEVGRRSRRRRAGRGRHPPRRARRDTADGSPGRDRCRAERERRCER